MFAGRWCQFRLHSQRIRLVTMHEAVKEQPKLRKAWISRVHQLSSSYSASTVCVHVAESSCVPVPCCTMIGRREGGVIFRVIPEWDNRFCLKMDASFCCCVRLSLQLSCSNCGLARLIFFHSPTLPFSDSLSHEPEREKTPHKMRKKSGSKSCFINVSICSRLSTQPVYQTDQPSKRVSGSLLLSCWAVELLSWSAVEMVSC